MGATMVDVRHQGVRPSGRGAALRFLGGASRPSRTAIIRADRSGRARRAGRPRHREDRGGSAPRRVPALHAPRTAGAARGVWSSGRNPTFLRYIGQVLPSLGESSGPCSSTVGGLLPGSHRRSRRAARGGRASRAGPAMATVVAAAVRDRQWVPRRAVSGRSHSEHVTLLADRQSCERPASGAWVPAARTTRPRPIVVQHDRPTPSPSRYADRHRRRSRRRPGHC